MKYIRTKYGVWEVAREAKDFVYVRQNPSEIGLIKGPQYESGYPMSEIIKQANTIEELCDELYFVEDETNIPLHVNRLHGSFDKDKKLTECCLEIGDWVSYLKRFFKKGCIKGAIFTSGGIIYVAKLNEKGEWELL